MSQNAEQARREQELAKRLGQNDEDALGEILDSLGPSVHAVLAAKYRSVMCAADVDDVLSIALFRLWVSREKFDGERGTLRVWFFRLAENALRDVLKHGWYKARQLEATLSENLSSSRAASALAADETADDCLESTLEGCLRRIIAGLPEKQRRIVLADAQAREDVAPSAWLAEQLGIPQATVRVYRQRALAKIRAELAKHGFVV